LSYDPLASLLRLRSSQPTYRLNFRLRRHVKIIFFFIHRQRKHLKVDWLLKVVPILLASSVFCSLVG